MSAAHQAEVDRTAAALRDICDDFEVDLLDPKIRKAIDTVVLVFSTQSACLGLVDQMQVLTFCDAWKEAIRVHA